MLRATAVLAAVFLALMGCTAPPTGPTQPSTTTKTTAPIATTTTPSTTTTTSPLDTWPTLTLTRMGIFGGGFPGMTYDATLTEMTRVFGPPTAEWPNAGLIPCKDYSGASTDFYERARTVQWGDLFVSFTHEGAMMAYRYGPRKHGRPLAYFAAAPAAGKVTLGTPLSQLFLDRDAYLDGRVTPYGHLWRVHSQAPGLAGFASDDGPDAVVTYIFVGTSYACFGLPRGSGS